MITKRIWINVGMFLALAAILVTWGGTQLVFNRETGRTSDISDLDPSAEGNGEGGWGGLSEFSGRANEAVARAVANAEQRAQS